MSLARRTSPFWVTLLFVLPGVSAVDTDNDGLEDADEGWFVQTVMASATTAVDSAQVTADNIPAVAMVATSGEILYSELINGVWTSQQTGLMARADSGLSLADVNLKPSLAYIDENYNLMFARKDAGGWVPQPAATASNGVANYQFPDLTAFNGNPAISVFNQATNRIHLLTNSGTWSNSEISYTSPNQDPGDQGKAGRISRIVPDGFQFRVLMFDAHGENLILATGGSNSWAFNIVDQAMGQAPLYDMINLHGFMQILYWKESNKQLFTVKHDGADTPTVVSGGEITEVGLVRVGSEAHATIRTGLNVYASAVTGNSISFQVAAAPSWLSAPPLSINDRMGAFFLQGDYLRLAVKGPYNTSPNNPDSDGDGQLDGHEVACGSDPAYSLGKAADLDGDGIPDCVDPDIDGDGLTNTVEGWAIRTGAAQLPGQSPAAARVGDQNAVAFLRGGAVYYAVQVGSSWVESKVNDGPAAYPSLAQFNGQPRIAFQDATSKDLVVASPNGASWSLTTVDDNPNYAETGINARLSNVDGTLWISYADSAGNLRTARYDGSQWHLSFINGPSGPLPAHSEIVSIGGVPSVAFHEIDDTTQWSTVRFAQYVGSWQASQWVSGDSPDHVSLFDDDGQGVIMYEDTFYRLTDGSWNPGFIGEPAYGRPSGAVVDGQLWTLFSLTNGEIQLHKGDAAQAEPFGFAGKYPQWIVDESNLAVAYANAAETGIGLLVRASDPRNPDTDGDGIDDGDEFICGTDPLVSDAAKAAGDNDSDGIIDCLDPNDDHDRLLDAEEGWQTTKLANHGYVGVGIGMVNGTQVIAALDNTQQPNGLDVFIGPNHEHERLVDGIVNARDVVVLDVDGDIGIAFSMAINSASTRVHYAHFNGTQWTVEPLNEHPHTGNRLDAFTVDGAPAIVYTDGNDVVFSTLVDGEWTTEPVPAHPNLLAATLVQGVPVVVSSNHVAKDVRLAQRAPDGTWSDELVRGGVNAAHDLAVFDVDGEPLVVYHDFATNVLHSTRFVGGNPVHQAIDASGAAQSRFTGEYVAGTPTVAFSSTNSYHMSLARFASGTWSIEKPGISLLGDERQMADVHGQPVITHITGQMYVTAISSDPFLTDTDGDGADDGGEVACGSDPLNPLDTAPDTDQDLLFDCEDDDIDGDGILNIHEGVQAEVVASPQNFDSGLELVHLEEHPVIGYQNVATTQFTVQMFTGESWQQHDVHPLDEQAGLAPSMAASVDQLVATYGARNATADSIWFATYDGQWQSELLGQSNDDFDSSVAFFGEQPSVAFANDTALILAEMVDGQWHFDTVITARTRDMQLVNAGDLPTIAFHNSDDREFQIAQRNATGWHFETLDIHFTNGFMSSMLWHEGELHVLYPERSGHEVVAINGTLGNFTFTSIDTGVGNGYYTDLAVVNGTVVGTYTFSDAQNQGVHLATLTPDGWKTKPMAAGTKFSQVMELHGRLATAYLGSNPTQIVFTSYASDPVKADSDDDGWPDNLELACGTLPMVATSGPRDTDGDNIADCVDVDDDNDGLLDSQEGQVNLKGLGIGSVFADLETVGDQLMYAAVSTGSNKLFLVRSDGLTWDAEEISTGHESFRDNIALIEWNGQPAIGYEAGPVGQEIPRFSYYNGFDWTHTVVNATQTGPADLDLQLINGRPTMVYAHNPSGDLVVSYFGGIEWGHEALPFAGMMPSVATIDGALALSYFGADTASLEVAIRTDTGWNETVVDSTFQTGAANNMVDTEFGTFVSYHDGGAYTMKVARLQGDVWSHESLGQRGPHGASLALVNGTPTLAYALGSPDDLVVTQFINGEWQAQVQTAGGWGASLADHHGRIAVIHDLTAAKPTFSAVTTDPLNPDTDGDGVNDGSEYSCGTSPLDALSVPGDLDRDGIADCDDLDDDGDTLPDLDEGPREAVLAGSTRPQAADMVTNGTHLFAVQFNGGPQRIQTSATQDGQNFDIQTQQAGDVDGIAAAVHDGKMAYARIMSYAIHLTYETDQGWNGLGTSLGQTGGTDLSLAYANNTWAATAYNPATKELLYTEFHRSYTETEVVASGSSVGPSALLSLNGQPAVAYLNLTSDAVHWMTRSDAGWSMATIATDAEPTHGLSGLTINGKPTLAYGNSTGHLQIVQLDGAGTIQRLPANSVVGVPALASHGEDWLVAYNDASNHVQVWSAAGYIASIEVNGPVTDLAVAMLYDRWAVSFTEGGARKMVYQWTDARNADTDGDSQLDGYEVLCGSNPLDDLNFSADENADGIPDCGSVTATPPANLGRAEAPLVARIAGKNATFKMLNTTINVAPSADGKASTVTLFQMDKQAAKKSGLDFGGFTFDLKVGGAPVTVNMTIPKAELPPGPWKLLHAGKDGIGTVTATYTENKTHVFVVFNTAQLPDFSPFSVVSSSVSVGAAAGGGGGGGSAAKATDQFVSDGSPLSFVVGDVGITLTPKAGAVTATYFPLDGSADPWAGQDGYAFDLSLDGGDAVMQLTIPEELVPAGKLQLSHFADGKGHEVEATITRAGGMVTVVFDNSQLTSFSPFKVMAASESVEDVQQPSPQDGTSDGSANQEGASSSKTGVFVGLALVAAVGVGIFVYKRRQQ